MTPTIVRVRKDKLFLFFFLSQKKKKIFRVSWILRRKSTSARKNWILHVLIYRKSSRSNHNPSMKKLYLPIFGQLMMIRCVNFTCLIHAMNNPLFFVVVVHISRKKPLKLKFQRWKCQKICLYS